MAERISLARWRAAGAVVVGAVALSCTAGGHGSARTTAPGPPCPVTRPTGAQPPRAARMNFGTVLATSRRGWFGNGSLWVELPQGSVLEAIPRRHSRFLETKFGWFRAVAGQVRVVGRPATGPPAPFRSQVGTVPEYGPRGFTPSGLGFGRAGCWQLTGTLAGTSLRIIVSVVPTVLP